ncbi:ferritin-like domain-containing protein [Hyphococcus sp.]|uniref:ferritin-like domain-containing protein n=1 Tax=Hyphococcus sp. TaxID=2038636 RepID=UPI003750131B
MAGAPSGKLAAAEYADALRRDGAPLGTAGKLPDRPARPLRPRLVPPGDTPKRRVGSDEGRAILIHAIAHIEFNAIDLAFDMAARFSPEIASIGLNSEQFAADWIEIGSEEAKHFQILSARLNELGQGYGDFSAHDGLWEAAMSTRNDVLARLAIAPLILEARGLDVTPDLIERLRKAGDEASASALKVIYRDEVGHVACGKRWFDALCMVRNLQPEAQFHRLRALYFAGSLKPPFNHEARARAGLPREFYEPIGNENSV